MRYADWPERLARILRADARAPFVWGTHDCVRWACTVCEALTGVDPSRPTVKDYASRREARAILNAAGSLLTLARCCADAHALPEIAPGLASRGDIVCLAADARPPFHQALGVCVGRYVAVPGVDGLRLIANPNLLAAWRIGCHR